MAVIKQGCGDLFGCKTFLAMTVLVLLSSTIANQVCGAPTHKVAVKTETRSAVKAQSSSPSELAEVTGDWISEWGPVTFKTDNSGSINGSWEEGEDKIGKIEAGKFDAKTGALNFDFVETWTGLQGKAQLKLSANHHDLSGKWTRGAGKDLAKGLWVMHRADSSTATK